MADGGPERALSREWVRTAARGPSRKVGRAHLAGGVLGLVLLLLVAGCGGSGGVALPSITATPTRSASGGGVLPSDTAAPTQSASDPTPSVPEPSSSDDSEEARPSASRDVVTVTREPDDESSESASAVAESPQASTSVSAEVTAAAQPSERGDTPGWLPWALLALVVGAAVVFALWQRQKSRRRDENASFDAAVAEARWLEAEVLPTLLEAPRDERRGAWRVARPRVAALEAALGELAAPNTDSVVAVNAQHLKSAVTGVRGALDDETLSTGPESTGVAYGAAKQAARQLNQVLTELQPAAPRSP